MTRALGNTSGGCGAAVLLALIGIAACSKVAPKATRSDSSSIAAGTTTAARPHTSAARPANPLLAAIRDTLVARNPRLNQFALLDLAIVSPWTGEGYVVIGYGLCDSTRGFTIDRRNDELFGVFAVDPSLTRIWHTFDVIPTPTWRDWYLRIVSATGTSVEVKGQSVDYGPGRADFEHTYSWPSDSYSPPPT